VPASGTFSTGVSQPAGASPPAAAGLAGAAGLRYRGPDRVPIGPLRLASPLLADESGWFYPLAVIAVAARLWRRRVRLPLSPRDSAMVLLAGWLVSYGVVLSFAGGVFHAYYLSALAPPACALAGIGMLQLWRGYREGGRRALALPVAVLLVVGWQVYISHGYLAWRLAAAEGGPDVAAATLRELNIALIVVPIALAVLSAGALLALSWLRQAGARGWPPAACAAGVLALTLAPATWALGTMQSSGNANSPGAQLPGLASGVGLRMNAGAGDQQLVTFLTSHQHGERFLAATPSSQQAAPLILATGKPVIAMGGFSGSDPILTPEQLDLLVKDKQLRFALVYPPSATGGFIGRGAAEQAPLISWIEQHGAAVEPGLWRTPRVARRGGAGVLRRRIFQGGRRAGGAQPVLYDLAPDAENPSPGSEQER
jgi:4-amino-4-deoxy-L-arabinose transferase-like glycosyltransferase